MLSGGLMNEKIKRKIEKRLGLKFKKIVLYKNPNEFSNIYIERVNPNHIGILWGKRHKKFNKGCHYIRCGKVFFSLPVIVGLMVLSWFDAFTSYTYNLLLSVGLISFCIMIFTSILIYWLPFRLYKWRIKLGVA